MIYSADWHHEDVRLTRVAPPDQRVRVNGKPVRVWKMTECNDEESEHTPFDRHRKWCALLGHAHFVQFVTHCDLVASSTPTMGSIGAPGAGYSHVPAFSFDYNDDREGGYRNAYVTPACDQEGAVALLRWLEWFSDGSSPSWEEALPSLIERIPNDVELTDDLWIKQLRKVFN